MKNLYPYLLRKTNATKLSIVAIILLNSIVLIQNANAQLINEPFTSSLDGWTVVTEGTDVVAWTNTNSAGGSPGEVTFTGNSQTAIVTDRLYSPPVNTSGMTSLTLTWNNYLYHYSSTSWTYGVSVETSSDGVTWHPTSWVTYPVVASILVGLQTITITTVDVGSPTFRISFTTTGQTFGMFNWYIDNPTLTASCTNATLFMVTGGGCNSGPVNLSGSQVGLDYDLYNGAMSVGPVVSGTGSAIQFGIQSTAGTYTVRTIADATYCATTMSGSATVTPTPTVTSASTGSICSNIPQNYTISSSVPGTIYTWSRAAVTGISNTAVSNQTNNPITESLINTLTGPLDVIYVIDPLANACPGPTFSYTVTVNPSPFAPVIGTIIQPSCAVGTGSVTLNNLPATGNWTITRDPGAITTNGSGSSFQITGLPAGATYTFTVTNADGCISEMSANAVINASPIPPTPVIVQNGSNLHSNATSGNQWYNQATGLIGGATNQNYPITVNGYFYCIVTISGCSSDTSNIIHVTNASISDIEYGSKINVFPNPASDKLYVNFDQIKDLPLSIKLVNSMGQCISLTNGTERTNLFAIDVSNFSCGLYTLQLIFDNGIVNKEVIVK